MVGDDDHGTTAATGPAVKRYVILIAYRPWDWSSATPEVRQSYFDAHDAFQHYVDEHGAHLGSAALGDADTATTLRAGADGARIVTDGPFAELAEQVGGYYDVELPDLDAAITAAAAAAAGVHRRDPAGHQDRGVRPAVTPDEALAATVREEWGRLVALLLAQFRRLDLVEDALADAVEAAARTWPRDGVPDRPAAWLLTAARRRVLDRLRAEAMAARTGAAARRRRRGQRPPSGRCEPTPATSSTTTCCAWCSCAATRRWPPRSPARSRCGSSSG